MRRTNETSTSETSFCLPTDHTNSATLFLILNFVLLVCFVGFAYLVALSSKTLSGNRSRSGRFQIVRTKKTRRENLSPRIMMQERVMKIIASDSVAPSPDLPGPRRATLRSRHCQATFHRILWLTRCHRDHRDHHRLRSRLRECHAGFAVNDLEEFKLPPGIPPYLCRSGQRRIHRGNGDGPEGRNHCLGARIEAEEVLEQRDCIRAIITVNGTAPKNIRSALAESVRAAVTAAIASKYFSDFMFGSVDDSVTSEV